MCSAARRTESVFGTRGWRERDGLRQAALTVKHLHREEGWMQTHSLDVVVVGLSRGRHLPAIGGSLCRRPTPSGLRRTAGGLDPLTARQTQDHTVRRRRETETVFRLRLIQHWLQSSFTMNRTRVWKNSSIIKRNSQ